MQDNFPLKPSLWSKKEIKNNLIFYGGCAL